MSISKRRSARGGLALGLIGIVLAAAPARAGNCEPWNIFTLDDWTFIPGPTYPGVQFIVAWNDAGISACEFPGDMWPNNKGLLIPGHIASAYDRLTGDWFFPTPYVDTLPEFFVVAHDSSDTASSSISCISLDSPNMRCSDEDFVAQVMSHELFHNIQRRFVENAGFDSIDISGLLGKWVIEGTARCLDDRFDAVGDASGLFQNDTNRLMTGNWEIIEGVSIPWREVPLTALSYRACLWWSYCCQRYGNMGGVDAGADFIRRLWIQLQHDLADDGIALPILSVDEAIKSAGGPGFEQTFYDYGIAMYGREFAPNGILDPVIHQFEDEPAINGSSGPQRYMNLTRTQQYTVNSSGGVPTLNGSADIQPLSMRLFELVNEGVISRCQAVGFRATADQPIGWGLIAGGGIPTGTVRPLAIGYSKAQGKEHARAFITTPGNPLRRLGAVAVAFGKAAHVDFTFGSGPMELAIEQPSTAHPGLPGPYDDPGRFNVLVLVEGPSELKPPGVGNISIKGLRPDDFKVTVGGIDATVVSATYVGSHYGLTIQAPQQAANGTYDLQVCLCDSPADGVVDFVSDGVLYGDYRINHMIVVDTSGSMQFPDDGSGSKLDAAIQAGKFQVDAVNERDRLGVVRFFGDDGPDVPESCNQDSDTIEGLSDATQIHRDVAKIVINNIWADGWTSMGDGIWAAQDEFDNYPGGLPPTDFFHITLLSDGEENEARFWAKTVSCTGDFGDPAKDRILAAGTQINTVALGPEANAALMVGIALQTGGVPQYIDSTDSAGSAPTPPRGPQPANANPGGGMANTVAESFLGALEHASNLERLYYEEGDISGGANHVVNIPVVDVGVAEAIVYAKWTPSAGATTVELRDPNGTLVTSSDADIFTSDTHAIYHIHGILAPGTWQLTIAPTSATSYFAGLSGEQLHGVQCDVDLMQVPTGGPIGSPIYGEWEEGVPVTFLMTLTNKNGPVLGATVKADVIRPDGTPSCATFTLRDDGSQDDGEPDDGVYGFIYTDTSQKGSKAGVNNDDPLNPNPGGVSGSYRVAFVATGTDSDGNGFSRYKNRSFHIYAADRNDLDEDTLYDTWEIYYGTDRTIDDAEVDHDGDGLRAKDELRHGTNPFLVDTDGGGETDGSEVEAGRCPLDPSDDALPYPFDVEVIEDTGHLDDDIMVPGANLLRFPLHPQYATVEIYRAEWVTPNNFVLIDTINPDPNAAPTYVDPNVVIGRRYRYRIRCTSPTGAKTDFSPVAEGTPIVEAVRPFGGVTINHGDLQTDSTFVRVSLDTTIGATHYRLSSAPLTPLDPFVPLPDYGYVDTTLVLDPNAGNVLMVWVQYRNDETTTLSTIVSDDIIYDPAGDFDNDGDDNASDLDDDGDDVKDADEVFVFGTNAYNADSDNDGLGDDVETADDCLDPRNGDTDGDGLFDDVDPSPGSDGDGDADTDMADFQRFQQCYTGPGPAVISPGCECLDADADGDIDEDDFNALLPSLTGP